jgi:hypothetical protein
MLLAPGEMAKCAGRLDKRTSLSGPMLANQTLSSREEEGVSQASRLLRHQLDGELLPIESELCWLSALYEIPVLSDKKRERRSLLPVVFITKLTK